MNSYQICTRCVMDTAATDIIFDEKGICNYCTEFQNRSGHLFRKDALVRQQELDRFVTKIKFSGKNKPYDCIVGVSGGLDSSAALMYAVELGLRPLAVHMDNGWNSELAQNNIANLVNQLDVDLYTHVIEWDEYRDLMQAFFDSDVIDVELLYDNAMQAVNFQQAAKYKLKYILSGTNQATEGMKMPAGWNWFKRDKKQIIALGQQFGNVRLKIFPAIGVFNFIRYRVLNGIQWISFLDYFDYNKAQILERLKRDFDYKPYPYKHYESIFTRFYQGYILPAKFGVDKRRIHLSTLIIAGQLSHSAALENLNKSPYLSEYTLEEDKQYFIKKMGWTSVQLQEYIHRTQVPHMNYPSEKPLWNRLRYLYRREMMKPNRFLADLK